MNIFDYAVIKTCSAFSSNFMCVSQSKLNKLFSILDIKHYYGNFRLQS